MKENIISIAKLNISNLQKTIIPPITEHTETLKNRSSIYL